MVTFIDPLLIPDVGLYTTGDEVQLGEVLELQLVTTGHATTEE